MRRSATAAVLLAGATLFAGACARQGAPTGGPDDRMPPAVVSVDPEPFATVAPGTDRLRVRFNERISEQAGGGALENAVQISPEVARYSVDHKRDGLDIHIPGGLRPGATYTIRLLPVIRDMFSNNMVAPFEWALSTGGTFTGNAVAGQVWDRVTGEPAADLRVALVPEGESGPDTLRWVATSGQDGLYALRLLPPGPFRLEAFQDRNRNRVRDANEPQAVLRDSLGVADTLFLDLPVLLPDTTPAALLRAELLDSMVVRLVFDDMLDPTVPVEAVRVSLTAATDTAAGAAAAPTPASGASVIPDVARLFHESRWGRHRDSLAAAADTAHREAITQALAAGDTARADALALEGPPPVPGGERGGRRAAGARTGPLPDGSPPPATTLVVLLAGPLPMGVPVAFEADSVTNLNRLPDGGGRTVVLRERPPPDTIPPATADTVPPADTARSAPPPLLPALRPGARRFR
ncbi:MAG: Ig-like domain-containing protein [Longimicrobiales bacterium]|nr:Ig-like domain-containing protein [Longimicrobiales bacterium]